MAIRYVQVSALIHRSSIRSANLFFRFEPPDLRIDVAMRASKALSIELRWYVCHSDSLNGLRNVDRKTCGIILVLRDKLDMNSSGERLVDLISATLLNIHTGIKILTNPADRFGRF